MQLQPHLTPGLLDSEAATPLLHPLLVPITLAGGTPPPPAKLVLYWGSLDYTFRTKSLVILRVLETAKFLEAVEGTSALGARMRIRAR
jgi:hypothetical protein